MARGDDAMQLREASPGAGDARARSAAPGPAPAAPHQAPGRLPPSATSMWINCVGVAALALSVVFLRTHGRGVAPLLGALVCLASIAAPIIVLENFTPGRRRPTAELDFRAGGAPRYAIAGAKLLGFYATIAAVVWLYVFLPEYRKPFYAPFFQVLRPALLPLAALAVPYFLVLERFNTRPLDGYWQVSLVLRRRFAEIDRPVLTQHLLGWLVKAFYMPIMFGMFFRSLSYLRSFESAAVLSSFGAFFECATEALFSVDLGFAVVGYTLALKLLDSHIRSTDSTPLGWVVTVMCYPPFWPFFYSSYLDYAAGGAGWQHWWSGHPVVYVAWGTAILLLTAVHIFSTVPFGLRFSNLTNRGILTGGPFRFTKHPAYLSKNVFWWLIAMPFLTRGGAVDAIRACLLLAGANFVYFMRARTEERHLSRDPAYVAYATAMEETGWFRWVGKLVPALRFRPNHLFNLPPRGAVARATPHLAPTSTGSSE
jgi:protein-S-isoprenylcysteine O-methyltransferase Ste14